MLNLEPHILMSMLEDERRRVFALESELSTARQTAIHWEHEAKALRREIQRIRQDSDTERIAKH